MKLLTVIVFVLATGFSFSQEWRDSLEVARKAYRNEDFKKALKYYKSAQKKAPDDIDLSDEIGQTAYKSGDYETAEKVFQQNGVNKRSKIDKAKNYHNIGNSRMRSKNYQGAVDAYKESLRQNPKDERTRYNLSEALRKLNKQKKEQHKKNNPNDKDPKDPKDPNGGQSGNDKKEGDGDPQKGKPGQGQEGNQPKDQKGDQRDGNKDSRKPGNQSQLPNKTVDRMLDELMKNEADTKRRMAGNGGGGFTPKSGKDW